jgi:hypothetical protein
LHVDEQFADAVSQCMIPWQAHMLVLLRQCGLPGVLGLPASPALIANITVKIDVKQLSPSTRIVEDVQSHKPSAELIIRLANRGLRLRQARPSSR